ncbi:hypothetical protein EDD15DRAFT_2358743 [Pisolithus albus]|nr:hypothetical protein EDD15DRAFT_2358743 [Pisolithus albus]
MPLEGEGMAHSNLHTLEGATTHLMLLNATRTRQGKALMLKLRLLEVGMKYLWVTGGARVASIELQGGKKASRASSKVFRGERKGAKGSLRAHEVEGTDLKSNQNHKMAANMSDDLLLRHEAGLKASHLPAKVRHTNLEEH